MATNYQAWSKPNYIEPWSAKAKSLHLYHRGEHSHNASFNLANYPSDPDIFDGMTMRDFAMDTRAEVNSSGLAKAGLVFAEILQESRDHYEVVVHLSDLGYAAMNETTNGYIWSLLDRQVDLEATDIFYEDLLKKVQMHPQIASGILEKVTEFKADRFKPIITKIRNIAVAHRLVS